MHLYLLKTFVLARTIFLVVFILLWACAEPICAQSKDKTKFPYQGFALHGEATVHSGPGQVHYATQTLAQGDVVEVYRHDPGGWCAIRPLEGSFSLLPEATLEIIDEGVGRVTTDGTQAWVGTKLGPVNKPLWQVKLKKGELVEVLGQVSWPSPEGHSNVWYQIAPPAGEFRWIKMSDIQLPSTTASALGLVQQPANASQADSNLQSDLARTPSNATRIPTQPNGVRSLNELVQQSPPLDSQNFEQPINAYESPSLVQQASLQTDQPINLAPVRDSSNQGWRQATRAITVAPKGGFSESVDAFDNQLNNQSYDIPKRDNVAANLNQGFTGNQGFSRNLGSTDSQRFASADVSAPNLARELKSTFNSQNMPLQNQNRFVTAPTLSALELQLTQEMLKDPPQWRLDDLEVEATKIYRNSQNAGQRQAAEKYLSKLTDCQRIKSGYASSSATGNPSTRQNQFVGTGISPEVQLGTTYDAHGWLTELVRNGGNSQSSYALQDASGKITHHVAPSPGMNLHRYLKKRIGIIGQRGYHNQLKLNHVTAQRVIELEDQQRRR